MEFVTLNTGINIPIVGSGTNTFGKVDRQYKGEINHDTTELLTAIQAGYRHFDTAISYRNEKVVGQAIKESGLPREAFFLTTKIPGTPEHTDCEQSVIRAVTSSLEQLGTDYLDLFLIHHPWANLGEMVLVWQVLENYVEQGTIKAIGVSNFEEKELAYLLENVRIKPAVNQIESHPGNWNDALLDFCLKNEVIPEAWGPLTNVSEEAKALLTEIGHSYGKTWAQVVLRYQIERGVIVIPKSHDIQRQKDNLAIFDFTLTKEEREQIAQL
ncbi:aldo/keto reductase family protein [Enterococcus sp. LJL98]